MEDKNGVIRGRIPYPSNEVSYHLIEYISCEGRYSVVYGYHFRFLQELRFGADIPPQNRLSIPYFLLQSMIDMNIKVQEGKHQQLAHNGLIKVILEDALQNLRLPITWTTFREMQAGGAIQALEYDKSPTASERQEETEEENEEETQEGKQEEKEEENEEETEEETKEETNDQSEELDEEEKEKDKNEKENGKEEIEQKEEQRYIVQGK